VLYLLTWCCLSMHTFRRTHFRLLFSIPLDCFFKQIMTSLQHLPTVLIHHIVAFVPDHVTLCRLECTCREVHTFISNNTSVWDALYQCRWPFLATTMTTETRLERTRSRAMQASSTTTTIITPKDVYVQQHAFNFQCCKSCTKRVLNPGCRSC